MVRAELAFRFPSLDGRQRDPCRDRRRLPAVSTSFWRGLLGVQPLGARAEKGASSESLFLQYFVRIYLL